MKQKLGVHLGFEIDTGARVEIPVAHMAVCGQTQQAGKTTALEALISRSGFGAVTFVTKRGEGAFASARRIDPYFREQADWQFVASILEASRGEKLKIERAWIIRASKGARTLADVHANVRKAMADPKIRGMSADMYLTLDAYLEVVVPQISRVRWASGVDLHAGVNAMDLTGISVEMQHLVIKSTIDWVLDHAEKTVVVIPEAWKFIPQGRGTPVKRSADAFIRQGAGLKNFLWLDSQDLGGIEKEILRSVPVWILGVQREANEIKRTLANIPAGVKRPKAEDIATLGLGQFFACWGTHVIRTYAQPAWMNPAQAEQVATGALDVNLAIRLSPGSPTWGINKPKENQVNAAEAQSLREENARLARDNEDLRRRLEQLASDHGVREAARQDVARPADDEQAARPPRVRSTTARTADHTGGAAAAQGGKSDSDGDALYADLLSRLVNDAAKDPILLKVIASKPELEVLVERRTVQIDGTSLRGRVAKLIAQGFFREPRTQGSTRSELKRTGPDINTGNLSRAFGEFVRDGFLTDEGAPGYREVTGMKVRIVEP